MEDQSTTIPGCKGLMAPEGHATYLMKTTFITVGKKKLIMPRDEVHNELDKLKDKGQSILRNGMNRRAGFDLFADDE